MTKYILKNSYTFRAIIAVLITAAIIFLPAAVFAEGEVTVDGDTAASEDFDSDGVGSGGVGNTGPLSEAPAPEIDANPVSQASDQQSDLQVPTSSDTTDAGLEISDAGGSAIEATADITGSTVDQQGNSLSPAAGSDAGCGVTIESNISNRTQYFQIVEESMNPMLPPGSMVEIVSESYADGDLVLAQEEDGTYIVKMLAGDQLVSLGAGTNYTANDVTILGAVTLSAMTQAELESSGIAWNIARATTSTAPAGGNGSTGTPFEIATWQNLYWLSQTSADWNKHYIQTAAITFPAEITTWLGSTGWSPIGNNSTKFTGTYNGQGYTISNLFINRPTALDQGLFGVTSVAANLTNIALVNVNVTGNSFVGGLVGLNDGAIENSYASGAVTGTGPDSIVGGLVGENDGTIENSYASGAVTGTGPDNIVGGLVGVNDRAIENSYASGAVTGTGPDNIVGGLVGMNSGNVTNSYYDWETTGQSAVDIGKGIPKSTADMQKKDTFQITLGDWDISAQGGETTIWRIYEGSSYPLLRSFMTAVSAIKTYDGTAPINQATDFFDSNANHIVINPPLILTGSFVGLDAGNNIVVNLAFGPPGDSNAPLRSACLQQYDFMPQGTINKALLTVTANSDQKVYNGIVYTGGNGVAYNGFVNGEDESDLRGLLNYSGTSQGAVNPGAYAITPGGLTSGNYDITFIDGELVITLPARSSFDLGDLDFQFSDIHLPVAGRALTAISGKGANPIITPAFVAGGSAADLGMAIAGYNQAKQIYEANKGTMSAADKAVAEVELAVANAAIKTLELSLAAQGGQAFDMAALISAYNNALAVLNANRGLLTAEQIAAAEALLQAIATVISRFSS